MFRKMYRTLNALAGLFDIEFYKMPELDEYSANWHCNVFHHRSSREKISESDEAKTKSIECPLAFRNYIFNIKK